MANNQDYSDSFSEFIRSLGRRDSSFSKEALDAISVAALKERLGSVSIQKDILEALKELKAAINNYSTTLNYSSRNLTKPQQDEIQDKIKAIAQIGEGITRFRQAGEDAKLASKLGVSQEKLAETFGISRTRLEQFNKTLDTRVGEELETFAQAVRTSTRSLTQVTRGIRKLENVITLEEAQKATFLQRNLKESPVAVSELLVNRRYLDPDKMRETFGDSFIESVKQSSDLNKGLYTTATKIKEGTGFFESFFVNTREVSKIQRESLSTFLKEAAFTKTEYRKTLTEIDEIIKSPKATEEEIAKQTERRRQIQKQLLDVTLEELNIRKKIFQETYGKLGDIAEDFAEREIDYIGSTTRNPFWDILTSSLKFGVQTGISTASAVSSMINRGAGLLGTPNIYSNIPGSGGGEGRGGGRQKTGSTEEGSKTDTNKTGRRFGRRIFSDGKIGGGISGALLAVGGIGYDYLTRQDDDSFQKELSRNLVAGGASIGAGILGGMLGQLVIPIPGVGLLTGAAASYFANQGAGALYDKFFGQKDQNELNNANIQNSSMSNDVSKISDSLPLLSSNLIDLNKMLKFDSSSLSYAPEILSGTSVGGLLGISALGRGGAFISNLVSGALKRLLPALSGAGVSLAGPAAGAAAGAAAFGIDFYLQSLNKSYDIYYSQYTQQNLIPQAIRRALGTNVADISNALILPGGLLKTGVNSLANLGYTREELLATIPRVTSSMLTESARSMAEAVKEVGSAARIFGTSISDSVGLIASARKSLIDYKDIFGIARIIAGGENFTQFTKAMTESFINASLSVATRQGTNPLAYATSITSLLSLLSTSRNSILNDLVKNNPDLAISAFQSLNEFIRGGISNPIAGGIGYRAGLTPRNILQGATPENLNRVLKGLVRETGIIGQVIGDRFTSQAIEYLLPLMQQQLGLGGISPDIFNEIVLAFATGRDSLAINKLKQTTTKGAPRAISADEDFGRQQEEILVAYQTLTDVMKTNIDKVVDLNVAITDLSKNIIKIAEPGGQFAVSAVTTAVDVASNVANKITGGTSSTSAPKLSTNSGISAPTPLNDALNAYQRQTQVPNLPNFGNGYVLFSTGEVTPVPMETLKMYLMQLMKGN